MTSHDMLQGGALSFALIALINHIVSLPCIRHIIAYHVVLIAVNTI